VVSSALEAEEKKSNEASTAGGAAAVKGVNTGNAFLLANDDDRGEDGLVSLCLEPTKQQHKRPTFNINDEGDHDDNGYGADSGDEDDDGDPLLAAERTFITALVKRWSLFGCSAGDVGGGQKDESRLRVMARAAFTAAAHPHRISLVESLQIASFARRDAARRANLKKAEGGGGGVEEATLQRLRERAASVVAKATAAAAGEDDEDEDDEDTVLLCLVDEWRLVATHATTLLSDAHLKEHTGTTTAAPNTALDSSTASTPASAAAATGMGASVAVAISSVEPSMLPPALEVAAVAAASAAIRDKAAAKDVHTSPSSVAPNDCRQDNNSSSTAAEAVAALATVQKR